MPFYENGPVRIHYIEGGRPSGHPLLLVAPGGLDSSVGAGERLAAL